MDIQIDLIVVDDAQAQNRTKLRKRDTRRQNQQRRRHHHKPKGRNRRSHFQSPSNEKYKFIYVVYNCAEKNSWKAGYGEIHFSKRTVPSTTRIF